MSERKRLVLLIDGDNAQAALFSQMLERLKEIGDVLLIKLYGDLSKEPLKQWRSVANRYNIEYGHYYTVSSGKNATDIVLVIDAMDILWRSRDKLDGICIASSDSDFTHLARRIRKAGLAVIGIGRPPGEDQLDAYDLFIPLDSAPSTPLQPSVLPSDDVSDENFLVLLLRAWRELIAAQPDREIAGLPLFMLRQQMQAFAPEYGMLKGLMPPFVEQVTAIANRLPNRFIVRKIDTAVPRQHLIYVFQDDYISKMREAYAHLRMSATDGWVMLSAYGAALHSLFPRHDLLTYRGARQAQFKKVITLVQRDYPWMIEMNTVDSHPCIRFKA